MLQVNFFKFKLFLVAQFIYIIRKRIQLEPEIAIFIFIERFMPNAS